MNPTFLLSKQCKYLINWPILHKEICSTLTLRTFCQLQVLLTSFFSRELELICCLQKLHDWALPQLQVKCARQKLSLKTRAGVDHGILCQRSWSTWRITWQSRDDSCDIGLNVRCLPFGFAEKFLHWENRAEWTWDELNVLCFCVGISCVHCRTLCQSFKQDSMTAILGDCHICARKWHETRVENRRLKSGISHKKWEGGHETQQRSATLINFQPADLCCRNTSPRKAAWICSCGWVSTTFSVTLCWSSGLRASWNSLHFYCWFRWRFVESVGVVRSSQNEVEFSSLCLVWSRWGFKCSEVFVLREHDDSCSRKTPVLCLVFGLAVFLWRLPKSVRLWGEKPLFHTLLLNSRPEHTSESFRTPNRVWEESIKLSFWRGKFVLFFLSSLDWIATCRSQYPTESGLRVAQTAYRGRNYWRLGLLSRSGSNWDAFSVVFWSLFVTTRSVVAFSRVHVRSRNIYTALVRYLRGVSCWLLENYSTITLVLYDRYLTHPHTLFWMQLTPQWGFVPSRIVCSDSFNICYGKGCSFLDPFRRKRERTGVSRTGVGVWGQKERTSLKHGRSYSDRISCTPAELEPVTSVWWQEKERFTMT